MRSAEVELESMRANLDAIASPMRLGPTFRLRGLDVHHVRRCTRLAGQGLHLALTPDRLTSIEELARRLERRTSQQEITHELLDALDDLFHIPYAILFTFNRGAGRMHATAGAGEASSVVGMTIDTGAGLVGMAATRRRLIVTANLQRARALSATGREGADAGLAPESPLPGLPDARNAAAVPLIVGEELLGVLYLESTQPGAFTGPAEGLLHIIGAHTAAALAARGRTGGPVASAGAAADERGGALQLVYYQADDTILCDSEYIVKGAPGRILWAMLTSHAESGRTEFTNRELRLDESLGLPAGNDNLETRLLVLRRRLANINCGVTLERVGRGRIQLTLQRSAELTVVPTTGPMRSAHAGRSRSAS